MNPKNILVAIQEKERWIERGERLNKELKTVQREKRNLLKELGAVKDEITRLDEALTALGRKGARAQSRSEHGMF